MTIAAEAVYLAGEERKNRKCLGGYPKLKGNTWISKQ